MSGITRPINTLKTKLVFLLLAIGISFSVKAQYADGYNIPDSTYLWSHLPNKATFLSALVPGLGQIYNEKYWKVPVIYAGFTGLLYYANYNNFVYKKYKSAYEAMIDDDDSTTSPYSAASSSSLLKARDNWRRYRDLCFIGIGVLYIAQIIDANVDAYLFDFDMSKDLTFRVEPMMMPPRNFVTGDPNNVPLGVRCTIQF